MIDYVEKRGFLRMPIDCDLSFGKTGSPERYHGQVVNLSSEGILFTSNLPFEVGESLAVRLSGSDTAPMEARVVVTRLTENDPVFEIACEIEYVK